MVQAELPGKKSKIYLFDSPLGPRYRDVSLNPENTRRMEPKLRKCKETGTERGGPVVGIVGSLHGNEKIGAEVIKLIKDIPLNKGALIAILANEDAVNQNKRYIDADLNRCFPGNENGNYEERLAASILENLIYCDYVIDIHSTTSDSESFVITTKKDEKTKAFANSAPLKKVVYMESVITGRKSLIENVPCGISLEFNLKTTPEEAKETVVNCLRYLEMLDGPIEITSKENYTAYGKIKKTDDNCALKLENFKEMTYGGTTFYPVLFGEIEYPDLLCLTAIKDEKEPATGIRTYNTGDNDTKIHSQNEETEKGKPYDKYTAMCNGVPVW